MIVIHLKTESRHRDRDLCP